MYNWTGYPTLPLSDDDWTWYTNTAQTMADTYPINPAHLNPGEFMVWAAEGLEIAESVVYPGK